MLEDSTRLLDEINKCLNGEMNRYQSIKICNTTPLKLQNAGLKDKPILFSQGHLRNCLHTKGKNPHWHGLEIKDVLSLQNDLENPAMIMDSFSDDYSVIVVTGNVDKEKNPIIASIRTDGSGQYNFEKINSNYLTSFYGKENFSNFISKSLDVDFMLYADKERIQNLEHFAKLQLLGNFSNDFEFNCILHQSENIVNDQEEKMENKDKDIDAYLKEGCKCLIDEYFKNTTEGWICKSEIASKVVLYNTEIYSNEEIYKMRRYIDDKIYSDDEIGDIININYNEKNSVISKLEIKSTSKITKEKDLDVEL